MTDAVLALNAGSSSLKFAVFRAGRAKKIEPACRGEIEATTTAPHFVARDAKGAPLDEKRWPAGGGTAFETLLGELLGWVDGHLGHDKLLAVGHRVVHGGRDFTAPVRVTEAVLGELDRLTPLAPLHQPHSLAPMRTIATMRPGLPQIACFDTAFHHTMPAVATRFALPREYEDEGVRHYGFHGLSYEYIAMRLPEVAPRLAAGRVVVAHLGNGASLCAMRAGLSIDTTMTFTALDGLAMGTRCGAIDPGVLLYMLQQKKMSPHDVEQLLYLKSGLLGVSGLSSDMRELLASDHPRAREAVELFVFRIARETAALAASLGGLDGFVFTAGIGEHAPEIRAAVSERLRWLGLVPGSGASPTSGGPIGAPDSRVEVHVIPTDEEAMIGQHTLETLAADGRSLGTA
jgi:acetate kinase